MTTTLTPYTPPPFERIAPRERIGSPHTWPVHLAEQAYEAELAHAVRSALVVRDRRAPLAAGAVR